MGMSSKYSKEEGPKSFSKVILEEITYFMQKINILGINGFSFFPADLLRYLVFLHEYSLGPKMVSFGFLSEFRGLSLGKLHLLCKKNNILGMYWLQFLAANLLRYSVFYASVP